MDGAGHLMRIGELSRRTGVSPDLLRVWERRYGLLEPARTPGGFRLYSERDRERVQRMAELIAEGFPASAAAQLAVAATGDAEGNGSGPPPGVVLRDLSDALARFDEVAANAAFDRALSAYSTRTVLAEVVLPYLQEVGRGWETGEVTIAQEHFASNIVRGRLTGLARGWGTGTGPLALLACPPGELHDLGLVVFGLTLREQGWRIVMLGANTPVATVSEAAQRLEPSLVVVASMQPALLEGVRGELADLGRDHRLALAGPGASEALATAVGASLIADSPVDGATRAAAIAAAAAPAR